MSDIAEEQVEEAAAAEPEPEVRPEELSQGIAAPIGISAFPQDVVDELRAPLDPNRVRRRKGRGSGQFEYLAGHDVKRRANEIFGFGNWGHRVVHRELLGAVEVVSENDRPGWHVGYATTVQVWVQIGEWNRYETEGVGYGDGVEYVPAARVTACELAIKESETDALKRAFTDLGDQFGLILYAKDDEKKRIARDESHQQTRSGPDVRVDHPEGPVPPRNFSETLDRLTALGHPAEDWSQWWIPQLIEVLFEGKHATRELNSDERNVLGQKLGTVVLSLERIQGGTDFPPPTRKQIRTSFANINDGQVLEGPPWKVSGKESDRPSQAELEAELAGDQAVLEQLAEETITGPEK